MLAKIYAWCMTSSYVIIRTANGYCPRNAASKEKQPFVIPYYRPQRSNIFTSVCQEVCPVGVFLSAPPLGRHPQAATPWADTQWAVTPPPSRHPLADTPHRQQMATAAGTVCILLECILVQQELFWETAKQSSIHPINLNVNNPQYFSTLQIRLILVNHPWSQA